MTQNILKVENLSGAYRGFFGTVQGIDGVTFNIKEGDRMAIAGESDAGQKPLIELLTGTPEPLLKYDGGTVHVKGHDIWHMDPKKLRKEIKANHLSYVPKSSLDAINPTQQLKEFAADMLEERHGREYFPHEAKEILGEHFERLGLDKSLLDRHPHELSAGQKQRATIAISTSAEPSILLIDEPTSSLDVTSQKKMVKLLIDVQRKGIIDSLLCVSHDLSMLRQLCDRLGIMYGGRIVEIGSMEDIVKDPFHPYSDAFISSLLPVERDIKNRNLKSISGSAPDFRDLPQGCRFHPRCESCMEICKEERPPVIEKEGRKLTCWLYADDD